MLQSLSIRNFVLIDELTIQFTPHFSVITGETGAGKSILLGAIALLMGQRADSSTIRPGAERCVIEARFTHLDAAVGAMLEEEDIDSDEEECIVLDSPDIFAHRPFLARLWESLIRLLSPLL